MGPLTKLIMANSPIPDQSKQFKESGMRLITDPASDRLLSESKKKKEKRDR